MFYYGIKSDDDKVIAYSYYYLSKIKISEHNYSYAIQYINIAIETYPEIYNTVKNEEIFEPIFKEIKKVLLKKVINSKLNEKDELTINHLNKTFEVVDTLSDYKNTNEIYIDKEKEI